MGLIAVAREARAFKNVGIQRKDGILLESMLNDREFEGDTKLGKLNQE